MCLCRGRFLECWHRSRCWGTSQPHPQGPRPSGSQAVPQWPVIWSTAAVGPHMGCWRRGNGSQTGLGSLTPIPTTVTTILASGVPSCETHIPKGLSPLGCSRTRQGQPVLESREWRGRPRAVVEEVRQSFRHRVAPQTSVSLPLQEIQNKERGFCVWSACKPGQLVSLG